MARSKASKWVGLALVGACGFGAYELWTCGGSAQDSMKHLANQVWIERLPENDRDQIHHLWLIEEGRDRFGAFGRSSTWRHFLEVFMWQREQNRLTLHLPQDRVRVDLTARVWECEGEAPAPFELCLEIKGQNGRTSNYYSRYEWAIDAEGTMPRIAGMPELDRGAAPAMPEGEFVAIDELPALGR